MCSELKLLIIIENKEKYLAKIYTDPSHPGSFSGPTKLKQVVDREEKHKISTKEISAFLEKQDTYNVNRTVRCTFRRGRIVTRGIKDQYDLDLIDMGRLSKQNDDVKFLLTAIDDFSRVAMVKPLKDKKNKYRSWSTETDAEWHLQTEGRSHGFRSRV